MYINPFVIFLHPLQIDFTDQVSSSFLMYSV